MTGQLLIYQQSSLDEAKRNPGLRGTVATYSAAFRWRFSSLFFIKVRRLRLA